MAIESEREGGTLIARAEDRVDGANARAFQDELESVISDNDREVVLDLHKLFYISSAGLRVILLTAKAMKRQETKFAVCCLSDPVREVFQISGFDKIIPVHPTLPEAMDALKR
jgi:anti-anti-sigma factor